MKSGLQNNVVCVCNQIDQTMFVIDSARQCTTEGMLQSLRFSDSCEGITPGDVFQKCVYSGLNCPVVFLPMKIVFPPILGEGDVSLWHLKREFWSENLTALGGNEGAQ